MLYLHGEHGGSDWLPIMDSLSQSFDLIVPEHPGYGRSETPDWLDTVADLAQFYRGFLEALGLGRMHVVGASIGGWIALEMAVRCASSFGSLSLLAPAGVNVKGVRRGDIFLWSPEETVRQYVADPALAAAMMETSQGEEQQTRDLKNSLTTAKLAWNPRLHSPHLTKWLHTIGIPTQLIWGDTDRVLPLDIGKNIRDRIAGSRLEVLRDCGHAVELEKPDEAARLIAAFAHEAGAAQ